MTSIAYQPPEGSDLLAEGVGGSRPPRVFRFSCFAETCFAWSTGSSHHTCDCPPVIDLGRPMSGTSQIRYSDPDNLQAALLLHHNGAVVPAGMDVARRALTPHIRDTASEVFARSQAYHEPPHVSRRVRLRFACIYPSVSVNWRNLEVEDIPGFASVPAALIPRDDITSDALTAWCVATALAHYNGGRVLVVGEDGREVAP